MSEFNAALGLLQLKYRPSPRASREIDAVYRDRLKGVKGIRCLNDAGEKVANYAYFPVLVEADYPIGRDDLYQSLKRQYFPRRYFYPLISDFPMYRALRSAQAENLPVATAAAQQVLCLPIYAGLDNDEVRRIADHIGNVS